MMKGRILRFAAVLMFGVATLSSYGQTPPPEHWDIDVFLGDCTVDAKVFKYCSGVWIGVNKDKVQLAGWEYVKVSGKKVYESGDKPGHPHIWLTQKLTNGSFEQELPAGPGKVLVKGKLVNEPKGLYLETEFRFKVSEAGINEKIFSRRDKVK